MENDETKMIVGDLNQINVKVRSKLLDIKSQVNSIEELEEINNEVRSSFKQFESKLEQLSICSEEAPSKSSREAIESDFNSYKSLLASLRTALRKANVECHAEIEKVTREALLTHGHNGIRPRNVKYDRASVRQQASDVTDNLTAVSRMLAEEVRKSERTLESLALSSNTLQETSEEFKNMKSVIGTSRKLLSKYDRRAFTDKLLIFLALTLFLCTVLYIAKKRLWPSLF